jgi:hypothetical protein
VITAITDSRSDYATAGFRLVESVFSTEDFAPLEDEFLTAAEELIGQRFGSLHDPALLATLQADLQLEGRLYDRTKAFASLQALGRHPTLVKAVAELMPGPFGVFEKVVMRIDMPHHEAEIAYWHQDFYYVGGNEATVTVWIPLQNVDPLNGCLEIAPGSHTMGPLDHPRVIGKRNTPSEELLAHVRSQRAPMARGAALLFHALLLHAGHLNQSEATRYSVQYRYSPLDMPTDPGMGRLIPVKVPA